MDYLQIAKTRQSCRSFDPARGVEAEKLDAVLEAAMLAPSACNAQPYHFTVCRGENARAVAKAVSTMGMNRFTADVPLFIVISEASYNRSAAAGAKLKGNDYRSIDIGIAAAYLTAEATAQGLSSCIIGWLDDGKLRRLCQLEQPVRLVIALGYAKEDDPLRPKQRKPREVLVTEL